MYYAGTVSLLLKNSKENTFIIGPNCKFITDYVQKEAKTNNGFRFSENIVSVFGKIWYNGSNIDHALSYRLLRQGKRAWGRVYSGHAKTVQMTASKDYKG